MGSSPFAVAVRISWTSSRAISTLGTALTTFVVAPLLGIALLVSVAAAMGSPTVIFTAYASLLLAMFTTVMASIVASVSTDRNLGVLVEVLNRGLWNPCYWGAKATVAVVCALPMTVLSTLALAVSVPDDTWPLARTVMILLPVAALAGAVTGVALSIVSLVFPDSYLLNNLVLAAIPLTSGVIAPISVYPAWAQTLIPYLPGSHLIGALRAVHEGSPWSDAGTMMCLEFAVALTLLALSALVGGHVHRTLRSGKHLGALY